MLSGLSFSFKRSLIEEMEGNGVVDLTINSHDMDRTDEGDSLLISSKLFRRNPVWF